MDTLYTLIVGMIFTLSLIYIPPILDNLVAWFQSFTAYRQNLNQKRINDLFAEEQQSQPAMGFQYEEPVEEYYEDDFEE